MWLELELEEVVVQVVHDVGFAEAHPAGGLAGEPQRWIAAQGFAAAALAADQAFVVTGRVALALGAVHLGRAGAVNRATNAVPAGRPGGNRNHQEQGRLNEPDSRAADRA